MGGLGVIQLIGQTGCGVGEALATSVARVLVGWFRPAAKPTHRCKEEEEYPGTTLLSSSLHKTSNWDQNSPAFAASGSSPAAVVDLGDLDQEVLFWEPDTRGQVHLEDAERFDVFLGCLIGFETVGGS